MATAFTAINPLLGEVKASGAEMEEDESSFRRIRRPQTSNPADFWFVSNEGWQKLKQDAEEGDGQRRKTALNNMRKREAAGRLMETDAGVLAVVPCMWCSRPGALGAVCRVDREKPGSCAYCKRYGKSGCNARMHPAPPTVEEELIGLRAEVATLQTMVHDRDESQDGRDEVEELREYCTQLRDYCKELETQHLAMRDQITIMQEALASNVAKTRAVMTHLNLE